MTREDHMPPSETVFRATALTKIYQSGERQVQALRGLDLTIAAGEVVVLLGPSGSGKSELPNIMGGPDQASSGQLLFRDLELTGLADRGLGAIPTTVARLHEENAKASAGLRIGPEQCLSP